MEVSSSSAKETRELAKRVAKSLKGGEVLALYGNLGAGKTTFVQGLVEALGIKAKVLSPTFVLIRHYLNSGGKIKKVNHVDLYRIVQSDDAQGLGILDFCFDRDSITVIEWPEVMKKELPEGTINIFFETVSENERKINVPNLH